ncbi:substrate-binding domain-containing protein [Paenibacillus sp. GSMTC-2017]|uniref:PstS family phosphate ABC transporter substrate-binding protein n=1 Tax=Paenibacillus sp. GSMTC-2017 TaxID=2794350 RepID=UPI0018D8D8A2|nr:substrate-binding domain-containing protein [Paenibacillus sp. GSMTC-2017]MBH5317697.1 substrate-binding domain-containing protein [Paenibacillus sp. GSMTC-2017]
MKITLFDKVMVAIICIPLIIFAGFIVYMMVSFGNSSTFYTSVVFWTTAVIILTLIFGLCGWLKQKYFFKGAGTLLLILIVFIAGYEIKKSYHDRFTKIVETEVKLYDYEPFTQGSMAVKLKGTSTFKINEDLPILDGATALYPLYSAFVQAVYPEKEYSSYDNKSEVLVSKTIQAYENLLTGKADLIFAAAPSEYQLARAKSMGIEFKLTPIGSEAFVFFVSSKNAVKGVTKEQIQNIYAGEITNWSQLGGKDANIRAFQRPEGSGSQSALQRLMKDKMLMTPPIENVAGGMGGIIEQTADYRNYPNAIGYSFLYYSTQMVKNGDIRLLEIDGVEPNRENIANASYPLSSPFYAVTAGTDNPNVEPFIEWIISEQGQELVEKTGYTPISIP